MSKPKRLARTKRPARLLPDPAPNRRDLPLTVKVTRDGVLTIEIGIDTLAFATLCSDYVWRLADEETGKPGMTRPDTLFKITDAAGFAREVADALTDEAEDGSSLLSRVLDDAAQKAIEYGAEHFMGINEEA